MPFQPHHRYTFSGTFGPTLAPYEAWAFRLNVTGFSEIGTPQGPVLQAMLTPYVDHVSTRVGSWCRLKEIKHASIGADGLYTGSPTVLATDIPGAATGANNPPQVALAVSLTTALRGPRGRGRFYLPAPAVAVDTSTGLITDAQRDAVATSMQSFINALNQIPNVGGVVIASNTGVATAVSGVRVGRVLDTIRSRRTSVPESYDPPLPITQ